LKQELKEILEDYLDQTGLKGDYETSLALKDITQAAKARRIAEKKANVQHISKMNGILDDIDAHKGGAEWGATSLIETDPFGISNKNGNFSVNRQSASRKLYSYSPELVEVRDTWVGSFGRKDYKNVNDEVLKILEGSVSSNKKANAIVNGFRTIAPKALDDMRAAGLQVGEIKDYLPNITDWERLYDGPSIKYTREEFVDDWASRVNQATTNPKTGKAWTDDELKSALRTYYQTLINGGRKIDDSSSGQFGGGLQVAHGHSRLFNFNSASDYAWLMRKYGSEDVTGGLLSYFDRVASDIAEVKTFGPRPEAMRRSIKKHLMDKNKPSAADKFDDMWGIAIGANGARPDRRNVAAFMSAARSVASAVQLPRAVISSFYGDPKNVFIKSMSNDNSFLRWIDMRLKAGGNSDEMLEFLRQQMIVADSSFNSASNTMARVGQTSEYMKTKAGRWASDIMNWSGMSSTTEAARQSYELSLQDLLGNNLGKSFDELPGNLRDRLSEWGVVADEWNSIRGSVGVREFGGTFITYKPIDIENLYKINPDIAEKIMRFTVGESRQTVIVHNVRAESFLNRGQKGGTVSGEFWRSTSQYMMFPAASWYSLWRPMFNKSYQGITKGKMIATALAGAVVMGAVDIWTRQILSGSTPQSLFDEEGNIDIDFLFQAGLRQDMIPVWGTLLFHFGGIKSLQQLAGIVEGETEWGDLQTQYESFARLTPVTSLVYDIGGKTLEPLQDAIRGEDIAASSGRALRAWVDLAGSRVGANLWYTQMAWRGLILDNLESAFDSDEFERRQDVRRRYMREEGREPLSDFLFE